MQSSRVTRSSVLGKRGNQQRDSASCTLSAELCGQLPTPDSTPNPKRPRTSITTRDGDSNKENIPPFNADSVSPSSPSTIALRRHATEIITPSRTKPSPGRRASMSSIVPATPRTDASNFIPRTPPSSPINVFTSLHARARALLRSTSNNVSSEMAGRDTERTAILSFLESFIDDKSMDDDTCASSLYISGSPGTGKTALINSVVGDFEAAHPDIKFLSINCMALKDTAALWDHLVEELGGLGKRKGVDKVIKAKGKDAFLKVLTRLQTKCVVILDELDHITPNPQSLGNLISSLDSASSNLRLMGIANTHSLSSSASFTLSSKTITLHFAPYTPAQLMQILQSRLHPLYEAGDSIVSSKGDADRFLPVPALTLLTKKIAAVTGDVRNLFEVLRGAIDISVNEAAQTPSDENPLNKPSPVVSIPHILAALKISIPSPTQPNNCLGPALNKTSSSEVVNKVRNLGLQPRLLLLSILLAVKRLEAGLPLTSSTVVTSPRKNTSLKRNSSTPNVIHAQNASAGIDTTQLHSYYSAVLTRSDSGVFDPVSRSEFGDLLGVLEGIGLVSLSSFSLMSASANSTPKSRRTLGRSVSFGACKTAGASGSVSLAEGVWSDEVLRGLGVLADGGRGDVMEEEIRCIWHHEQGRLAREIKASTAASAANASFNAFADASED